MREVDSAAEARQAVQTRGAPGADPGVGSGRTLDRATGIVMAVHRCAPDEAMRRLVTVARTHGLPARVLAAATVEVVHGAAPSDLAAAQVSVDHLLGRLALRPVLDGQVHESIARAGALAHHDDEQAADRLVCAADERDRAAEARDRAAEARDAAAGARHEISTVLGPLDVHDREMAAVDRILAGEERDLAAEDRADLLRWWRSWTRGPAD